MVSLSRNGFTEAEIKDALHGRSGSRKVKFRYDVIRNGVKTGEVHAEGSVALDKTASIQRTGKFTFYKKLDWLKDEVKPYMLLRMDDAITTAAILIITWNDRDTLNYSFDSWDALNMPWNALDAGRIGSDIRTEQYAEFPLGVFVLSTPARQSDSGFDSYEVEAYDHTVILNEDSVIGMYFIAAGTNYLAAVEAVLTSAGITGVIIQDFTESVLPADREFEAGTTKLSIANTLLDEINFNPIRCDADGKFVISKYREPSPDQISYIYKDDELSVIGRDTSSETDFYGVPNVFIAVCSNADLDENYRSVWTNDSPTNALSTINRGRAITSEIYQPSTIGSQADLDAYIRRIAFEANQVYEELTFTTALMPIHESGDILEIRHPDTSGTFVEYSWSMDLSYDGQMLHLAKRLVSV
jgi:hypothetical protein